MSNLKPTSHEEFLKHRFPKGQNPFKISNTLNKEKGDTIESNNSDSGGTSTMDKYITKDAFEQFEKRIDGKLDSLPDRMADKMDAKISGLEARQTKWFVGIAISTAIGGLSLIIAAIGLIINMFL